MPVVSTMLLRSLRMTGEKPRGATLTTAEQTECLAELNTMLESWSLERLMCYQITEDTFALTASTNSYTIGTNGVFAVTRPTKIVPPCFVRDGSGYDTPVEIISAEVYGGIVDKSAGYTTPKYLFYDGGYSSTSTATLYLYPSPSGSLTLHINSWRQLQQFSTLTHTLLMPPGYQLAIESNYAIHSAAGLVDVSDDLKKIARDAKAAIKGVNLPEPSSRLDAGIVGGRRGSILTG